MYWFFYDSDLRHERVNANYLVVTTETPTTPLIGFWNLRKNSNFYRTLYIVVLYQTAQKMKFFMKDFVNTCNQIRSFLQIWSHILKKYLMENFNTSIFVQCRLLVSFLLFSKHSNMFCYGWLASTRQNLHLQKTYEVFELDWC